jgi:hypothetical protein
LTVSWSHICLEPNGGNEDEMNQHTKANALGYATTLACALWEKHYKAEAPDWKPQPDLLGLLTQIDNMTAGLVRLKVTHTKRKPFVIEDDDAECPYLP